ncbi:excinuclease [Acinetobacter qingfengensis]|uniref:Excinuclease n=1 Tax=Acinetobacter qingfengensis TaxID=1262585 RepID=A0A1E7R2V5_9GAMM|nr:excinuclease [Acinetobacter qingfengensis]KAA8733865.1 excinuclease [Acinetobacter qingfengensis]OEY93622.1 excinuclease [Acinetobacter qingfengensis]
MLKRTIMLGLFAAVASTSYAKDEPHHFNFNQAVQNATDAGAIDGSVKFYLADTRSGGKLIRANVITNRKTNGFAKSAETSCDWAIRAALIQLQQSAKAQGANAVTNIVSYFRKNEYRSRTDYECYKGTAVSAVTLKGDFVKF